MGKFILFWAPKIKRVLRMDLYKFTQGNSKYIYDSNINQIVKVDDAVYNILPFDMDRIDKENLLPEMREALNEIEEYRKEYNLFRPKKAQRIYIDFEDVKKKLNSNIHHLILNVTDRCNMRCKYCVYGEYYKIGSTRRCTMSWKTAKRAIDFLLEKSELTRNFIVGFYGGEPLLEFELIKKIVLYAKERIKASGKKVRFSITTNGTIIDRDVARFLIDENFSVLISIDGPEDVHDRYRIFRNGKGTWKKINKSLQRIRDIDEDFYMKHVGFSIVLAPPFELIKVHDFFKRFNLSTNGSYIVTIPNRNGTTFYDSFPKEIWLEYDKQIKKLRNIMIDDLMNKKKTDRFIESFFIRDLKRRWHDRMVGESELLNANGICIPGHQRTFIDVKGYIYPCEKLSYRLRIGHISRGFDLQRVKSILDSFINTCEKCYDCWLRRTCSICFSRVVTKSDDGDFEISDERKSICCKKEMKIGESSLLLYVRLLEICPWVFGDKSKNSKNTNKK